MERVPHCGRGEAREIITLDITCSRPLTGHIKPGPQSSLLRTIRDHRLWKPSGPSLLKHPTHGFMDACRIPEGCDMPGMCAHSSQLLRSYILSYASGACQSRTTMRKSRRHLNKAYCTASIPGASGSLLTFTGEPLWNSPRASISNLKPLGKIRQTISEMRQELRHRCWILGSLLSCVQLTPRGLGSWYTI